MKRPLAVLLAVLAVLLLLERGWSVWRSDLPAEIEGAEWIWAPGAAKTSVPVAFYLARDFDLGDLAGPDRRSPAEALRFALTAEGEYQLFVNGRFVGAGSWMQGEPLDVYDVTDLLRAGRNRILVELRSLRGAGGLLGSLYSEKAASPLLVTDDSWQVLRHHRKGLHEGTARLGDAPRAASWGSPPAGRWGRVSLAADVSPSPSFDARRGVLWATAKSRTRLCHSSAEVEKTGLRLQDLHLEAGETLCESVLVVDFERGGCGYLELDLDAGSQRSYRVWFGQRTEQLPGSRRADEQIVLVPGSRRWRAAHLRDASRVWIAGVEDVRGARLRLQEGASGGEWPPPEEGVWGFEPPATGPTS